MQTLYKATNKYTDGLYLFTRENDKITWICDYEISDFFFQENPERLLEKEAEKILKDKSEMYYDDNIGALREGFEDFIRDKEIEQTNVQNAFETFAATFENDFDNIEKLGTI